MKRIRCFAAIFAILLTTGSSPAAPATALDFTPDGTQLLSGGHRRLEIRAIATGDIVDRVPCELDRISSLEFSRTGQWLIVSGGTPAEKGAALLYSWKDRRIQTRFTNFTDLVSCASLNHEETWVALGSADGSATLIPISSKSSTNINLVGHSGPVLDVAWSQEGTTVVTASADRSLKVWSAKDGRLVRSFSHHTEPVHAVAFRPTIASEAPLQCASASDDGTVRIWQPMIGRMVRIIRGHEGPVFALAYTPDGQKLFSAGKEGLIRRLDTGSDEILGQWNGHSEPVYRLAASRDGEFLASGDWAGIIHLWKISEKELRQVW